MQIKLFLMPGSLIWESWHWNCKSTYL